MPDTVRRQNIVSPPLDDTDPLDPPPSLIALFWVFAKIGLMSFGGALGAWVHREVSVKRRWMTEAEVLSGLALGQVMPGVNVVNLAIYVGQRLRGVLGSLAAVSGMIVPPFFLIIGIATVYDQLSSLSWLPDLMTGIAASAGGLLIHMGGKASRRAARSLPLLLVLIGIFVGVGVLRLHMVPVVLCLAPLSIWAAFRQVAAQERTALEKSDA